MPENISSEVSKIRIFLKGADIIDSFIQQAQATHFLEQPHVDDYNGSDHNCNGDKCADGNDNDNNSVNKDNASTILLINAIRKTLTGLQVLVIKATFQTFAETLLNLTVLSKISVIWRSKMRGVIKVQAL